MVKPAPKESSLHKCLYMCFYIIFCCFCIYITVLAVNFYIKIYGHNRYTIIYILMAMITFLLILFLAWVFGERDDLWTRRFLVPLFLFVASIGCAYIIIISIGIDTNQVSDFNTAFLNSKEEVPNVWYRIFSNWLLYVKYLQVFVSTPLTGIVLNALLTAASSVLIYSLMLLYGFKTRVAIMASLIFIFWPAHLFYIILLSPEFVNIFLVLVALNLFKLAAIKLENKYISWPLFMAASAVLAVGGFFKSIDAIALIAIGIVALLNVLQHSTNDRPVRLYWKRYAAVLLIVIVSFFISKHGIYAYLDSYAGAKVNRDTTPHFIYVGLSPFTNGSWSREAANVYEIYVKENNFDFDAAKKLTYEQLSSEIKEHKNITLSMLNAKMDRAWSNNAYLYFVNQTINNDKASAMNRDYWLDNYSPMVQLYWMGVCILTTIGAVATVFVKKGNDLLLFSSLIVFGFALVLLFIENQPRYKCVLYPYMSILAACGLESLRNYSQRIFGIILLQQGVEDEKQGIHGNHAAKQR